MPKFQHSLDAVGSVSVCEVVERLTRAPIGVQVSDLGIAVVVGSKFVLGVVP
jgi:hypothetical protein